MATGNCGELNGIVRERRQVRKERFSKFVRKNPENVSPTFCFRRPRVRGVNIIRASSFIPFVLHFIICGQSPP